MPSVEGPPPATSAFRSRSPRGPATVRSARFLGAGLLLLPLGMAVALWSAPAGAASVAGLQAQAATLGAELIQAQLRVDGVAAQYEVAEADVTQDEAAIASTQHQVTLDAGRVSVDHRQLLREALASYVNSGVAEGLTPLFASDANAVPAEGAYEQIVIGNTTDAIDQLHTAEVALHVTEGSLRQQEAEDRATETREALLTTEARTSADQLAAEQSQVTGQLALAIAQQRAAVAASAAAARSSAAAPGNAQSAGTAVVQQASSDPPLPPFLQCVVRVESGGDYGAVSADGLYRGAFQFAQSTWNEAASLAGLPGLVGEPPNLASKADQDTLAIALYDADGEQPWLDGCS